MSAPSHSPAEGDTQPERDQTTTSTPNAPNDEDATQVSDAAPTTTQLPPNNATLLVPATVATRTNVPYPQLNSFDISSGRHSIQRRDLQGCEEYHRVVVGQLPRKVREAFNAVQIAASTLEVTVWNPIKLGRNVIQVCVETETDRDKLLAANDRMFCQQGTLFVATSEDGKQELLQRMSEAEKGTPRNCLTFALPKPREGASSPSQDDVQDNDDDPDEDEDDEE
jgi:hypothetical protein